VLSVTKGARRFRQLHQQRHMVTGVTEASDVRWLRPVPEVAALSVERSPWRRLLRALWCVVLAVAGQLVLAIVERCQLRLPATRTFLPYFSPFARGVRDILRPVRAPPSALY